MLSCLWDDDACKRTLAAIIQTYALFQIQELQHDIEHHSAGVASVLNLCEVLLHDSDACPTEVEFNALQNTMKTLDRRWRNICQLSPERRSRCVENMENIIY